MLHYNVCSKMMEKGRNIRHPTCFFPSPSFYYIHCSEAWHLFQIHTFRSRQALRVASWISCYNFQFFFLICTYPYLFFASKFFLVKRWWFTLSGEAWLSGYIFQEHLLLGFSLCIESWIICYISLGDKSVSLLFFLIAIIDSLWKAFRLLKTNT